MATMSSPKWNVCGAQYRKRTFLLSSERIMSTAGNSFSTKSSGCGSTLSVMPSRSRIGTSTSIERHHAASLASVVIPPAQQDEQLPRSGCGPRPNSEFMVSTPSSTATWMAFCQYQRAAWRSASSGLAQRYIGSSEAIFTPCSVNARLKERRRSG